MPNRTDKFLLILGFVLFLIAVIAINIVGAKTKDEISIDYIHWLMLVGTALQIPFAARLPRRGISLLAAFLILCGIVCTIGMCMLDFVFWSLPDDRLRGEVARQLMDTPTVWQPFMMWGTEEVFYAGIVLASVLYLPHSKLGTPLVIVGAVCAIAGGSWFNVVGVAAVALGFLFNFNFLRTQDNLAPSFIRPADDSAS
ncbi:MAG: hypothetical protein ACJAQT_005302 [Akkermansiaceae bacterium]|jgi:hypothetical protein